MAPEIVKVDKISNNIWVLQGKEGVRFGAGTGFWNANEIPKAIKAVNKGAVLLDEKNPGWEAKVTPTNLKMYDGSFCIIGQVYGSYNRVEIPFGMDALEDASDDDLDTLAEQHGFLDNGTGISYPLLDRVWVYLLTVRAQLEQPVLLAPA